LALLLAHLGELIILHVCLGRLTVLMQLSFVIVKPEPAK